MSESEAAFQEIARVSRLPWRDGDGYSYGGEVIVSIGEKSFVVGGSQKEDFMLAREIALRWNSALSPSKEQPHE